MTFPVSSAEAWTLHLGVSRPVYKVSFMAITLILLWSVGRQPDILALKNACLSERFLGYEGVRG